MSTSAKTIGAIRILTTRFLELRKDQQGNKKTDNILDIGGSLNDNGKTRYHVDNKSLLGNDKNNSLELVPLGRNKYIDIFNATNVLYEEMKLKCNPYYNAS
jgi:hypothetical protein